MKVQTIAEVIYRNHQKKADVPKRNAGGSCNEVNSCGKVSDTGYTAEDTPNVATEKIVEARIEDLRTGDEQECANTSNGGGKGVTRAKTTLQGSVLSAPCAVTGTVKEDDALLGVDGNDGKVNSSVDKNIQVRETNREEEAKGDIDIPE